VLELDFEEEDGKESETERQKAVASRGGEDGAGRHG